ncbi:hypothetical protein LTR04_005150 [Oleoguttula sp. CCFEE 6159]|nr:hypothetical protein LTR04_005150 [Oleoguttula sp. CCFEE 6159]
MPISTSSRKKRRKVVFNFLKMQSALNQAQPASERLDEGLPLRGPRLEELSSEAEDLPLATSQDVEEDSEDEAEFTIERQPYQDVRPQPPTPALFTSLPPIRDELETATSLLQEKTIQECLPFLAGMDGDKKSTFERNSHGIPKLQREMHIDFLQFTLGHYPSHFAGIDASRPWILYWALNGLLLLGQDVGEYRLRVIQTLTPFQNATGGFGGGHGQTSHCAASYAAVLSLAIINETDAHDMIDRKAMWQWLGSIKQPDGSFTMAVGGEKDVRGAYCSMVLITVLNLPLSLPPDSPARAAGLETFTDGLGTWLSRCQTFEGGIGGAPGNEAHGAYAFCALACLCTFSEPYNSISHYLDVPALVSWLSARQMQPEGGFAGRTNKLVDGCYSHWVGGCWPLIEAALAGPSGLPTDLWSREGLVRYLLSCCQNKRGGMRDKPSARPDGYHSCYCLAGLSTAQNHSVYVDPTVSDQATSLGPAFNWMASHATEAEMDAWGYDATDRVDFVHPVFVLPWGVAERTRAYFAQKAGF